MPIKIENISPNQSWRVVRPRLIVLHDTEGGNVKGVSDLQGLGSWFDRRSTRASCHIGIDAQGNSIRIVPDSRVAWHAGWVNHWSLGIEQVGFASWSKDQWVDGYHLGLYRVASQIATWSTEFDIPIVPTKHGYQKGVTLHRWVSGRGGHWDPGFNYPINYVIDWARLIKLRRQKRPNKAKIREYTAKVQRVQKTYRPGRVNTRPW